MRRAATCFITSALIGAAICSPAAAQWVPTKNVEVISAVAAGGAPDGTARIVQRIFSEKKLIPVSSVVVNRPGGQQTIAMNYLAQRPRDGHYIAVASTPLLSNHIIGASTQHYRDFTPFQLLFSEYLLLAVRTESPIKDIHDLIARMKKNPTSLSYGVGTSIGGIAHIAGALGLASAGVDITKMKAVVFNSSADAMTAVLGGHLDVAISFVNVLSPMVETGKMRALVVTSPERQPGVLANAPSWKETRLRRRGPELAHADGPQGHAGGPTGVLEEDRGSARPDTRVQGRSTQQRPVGDNGDRDGPVPRRAGAPIRSGAEGHRPVEVARRSREATPVSWGTAAPRVTSPRLRGEVGSR